MVENFQNDMRQILSYLQLTFQTVSKNITINGIQIWAQRLSYVGELGYELYVKFDDAKNLLEKSLILDKDLDKIYNSYVNFQSCQFPISHL